jgi:hypothetical protein
MLKMDKSEELRVHGQVFGSVTGLLCRVMRRRGVEKNDLKERARSPAIAGTDWLNIKVLKSCDMSSPNEKEGEKARRTFDSSGVVRNENVDDVSKSGEGTLKEFDQWSASSVSQG